MRQGDGGRGVSVVRLGHSGSWTRAVRENGLGFLVMSS